MISAVSELDTARLIRVKNTSGETAPAFAAMRMTGVGSDGIITIGKPDTDDSQNVVFNGPGTIPNDEYGVAYTLTGPLVAACAVGDGTPTAGQDWGVEANGWHLRLERSGFRILGSVETGLALVTMIAGGGSVSLHADNPFVLQNMNGEHHAPIASLTGLSVGTYFVFASVYAKWSNVDGRFGDFSEHAAAFSIHEHDIEAEDQASYTSSYLQFKNGRGGVMAHSVKQHIAWETPGWYYNPHLDLFIWPYTGSATLIGTYTVTSPSNVLNLEYHNGYQYAQWSLEGSIGYIKVG